MDSLSARAACVEFVAHAQTIKTRRRIHTVQLIKIRKFKEFKGHKNVWKPVLRSYFRLLIPGVYSGIFIYLFFLYICSCKNLNILGKGQRERRCCRSPLNVRQVLAVCFSFVSYLIHKSSAAGLRSVNSLFFFSLSLFLPSSFLDRIGQIRKHEWTAAAHMSCMYVCVCVCF